MIRVFDFDSLFILLNASLQVCKFASYKVLFILIPLTSSRNHKVSDTL